MSGILKFLLYMFIIAVLGVWLGTRHSKEEPNAAASEDSNEKFDPEPIEENPVAYTNVFLVIRVG